MRHILGNTNTITTRRRRGRGGGNGGRREGGWSMRKKTEIVGEVVSPGGG